jgi:hypothetical protein
MIGALAFLISPMSMFLHIQDISALAIQYNTMVYSKYSISEIPVTGSDQRYQLPIVPKIFPTRVFQNHNSRFAMLPNYSEVW